MKIILWLQTTKNPTRHSKKKERSHHGREATKDSRRVLEEALLWDGRLINLLDESIPVLSEIGL